MTVQDEHLVLEELQLTDPVSATPAAKRSRLRWVQPATIAVLAVGLTGAGVIVVGQGAEVDHLRSTGQAQQAELDELKQTAAELDTALTALGGEDETASVTNLQGALDENKKALASLDERVVAAETRLKRLCDEKAVSNQQSSLDGQQMADEYTSWQYYSNLSSVMDAICGTEADEAPAD